MWQDTGIRNGRRLGWVVIGLALGQALPMLVAQQPAGKPSLSTPSTLEVVAYVNGAPVTRQELAEELIARKGRSQLELLINRKVIEQAAQKANLTVTDAEVEADLKEFMSASGCSSVADFEKRVLKERHTSLYEYKEDVIKPAILMRKLGGTRVQVTDEDLRKAFESKYGEKVQCRVIIEQNQKAAFQAYAEVKGNREAFIRRAKTQADPTLAATAGQINPLGRFSTYDKLEQRAFEMQDGEMSEVLQVPEGYVILLREKMVPADKTKKFEDEREALRRDIAEKKLRQEVPKLFKELKDKAVVRDFLNNKYSGDIKQIMEEMSKAAPAGSK